MTHLHLSSTEEITPLLMFLMPAIIFDKVVTPFLTSVTTLYRSDLFVGVGPTCLVVPCCV